METSKQEMNKETQQMHLSIYLDLHLVAKSSVLS